MGRGRIGVYATDGRIYLGSGAVGRLWGGRGGNHVALICSSPDFNINLSYQSHDRPMGEEVVRILRGMAGELSLFGDVLIIGDSTSAYCFDRKGEMSWGDIRAKAQNACGVNFFSESWSGATPPRFS